ncbi:MAG TPA: hypothetical protein VN370_03810 [Desulfitobacteriaceae bacterium]|jgi:hypothetical protein|nr:hypothetical protein [Desulfitobacteriaceae bacterium]
MFKFIKKTPFGFALTLTAIILAVSPEAREATRKFAVKGSAALMDLIEQIKNPQKISQQPVAGGAAGETERPTPESNLRMDY